MYVYVCILNVNTQAALANNLARAAHLSLFSLVIPFYSYSYQKGLTYGENKYSGVMFAGDFGHRRKQDHSGGQAGGQWRMKRKKILRYLKRRLKNAFLCFFQW